MQHNGSGNGDNDDEGDPASSSDANPAAASLSLDAILSLLAHHQRRDLLRYLADDRDQTAGIDDCIAFILRREEERSGDRPAYDQVEANLHHLHIPKLAEAGVLDYDPRNKEIRYRGHDHLEAWLERIRAGESEET